MTSWGPGLINRWSYSEFWVPTTKLKFNFLNVNGKDLPSYWVFKYKKSGVTVRPRMLRNPCLIFVFNYLIDPPNHQTYLIINKRIIINES